MNNRIYLTCLLISFTALSGCGQLTRENTGTPARSALDTLQRQTAQGVETVVATTAIKLSTGQGCQVDCVVPTESQSPIVFDARSNLSFAVNKLAMIEADGCITLNIVYDTKNDPDLLRLKLKACLINDDYAWLDAWTDGLSGENHLWDDTIPLEIQVIGLKQYQPLTHRFESLKVWENPTGILQETLALKVRGDFTNALKQRYSGTVLLKISKEEKAETAYTWTPVTGNAKVFDRYSANVFEYNNKLWVMGGSKYGEVRTDIWTTGDGNSWTCVATSMPWGKRSDYTSIVYNGKMWMLGGIDSDGNPQKDVWYSTDGITWTCATDQVPWPARSGARCVVYDNKLWIVGGDNKGVSDVWYTTDGKNWTCATNQAPWSARRNFGCVVFENKLWVIGGLELNYFQDDAYIQGAAKDSWYTTDGMTWKQAASRGDFEYIQDGASAQFKNNIWVVGGGVFDHRLYYSPEGTDWVESNVPCPFDGGYISDCDLTSFMDKLWFFAEGACWTFGPNGAL